MITALILAVLAALCLAVPSSYGYEKPYESDYGGNITYTANIN